MLLVLNPLGLERKHLLEAGAAAGLLKEGVGSPFHFVRGALGKVDCALRAYQALTEWPEAQGLLCVGSAGALRTELSPGQIVIATETIEHDFYSKVFPSPPPRFPADPKLLEIFRSGLAGEKGVSFAPIASGDEDVVDRERAETIAAQTGAWAVAWEGAGCARACRMMKKPFLEIRVVTDGADPRVAEDFHGNVQESMARMAGILKRIGESVPRRSRGPKA